MKILILTFYYPPDLCAGSFRVGALVKSLINTENSSLEIQVLTTHPNRYQSYSSLASDAESIDCVKINRIRIPAHSSGMIDQSRAFCAFFLGACRFLKGKDYDLVFATSSRLLTASLGAYIAWRKRAPLFLDIRDIFLDTLSSVLNSKIRFPFLYFFDLLEKLTMKNAIQINLVSKGFQEYFLKRYPTKKLSFISNGIDNEFLDMGEITSNDKRVKRVLYAGNIGKGQGLDLILPALAKSLEDQRIHFTVIGDGGQIEKLKNQVNIIGCNNIEIKKPINRNDLIKEYKQADILFLHLNDMDAFKKVLPSKIFEYAASGKPILAGVSGYAATFLKEEVIGSYVFEPCDVEGAHTQIKKVIYENIDRSAFKSKYLRENLMNKLASDIIDSVKGTLS